MDSFALAKPKKILFGIFMSKARKNHIHSQFSILNSQLNYIVPSRGI